MSLNPHTVQARLDEIDRDLAERLPQLEEAGRLHFIAKRDREQRIATAFLAAEGTVAERNAIAAGSFGGDGAEEEAAWESLRAAVRVLETRAQIGMALLKSYGRAS